MADMIGASTWLTAAVFMLEYVLITEGQCGTSSAECCVQGVADRPALRGFIDAIKDCALAVDVEKLARRIPRPELREITNCFKGDIANITITPGSAIEKALLLIPMYSHCEDLELNSPLLKDLAILMRKIILDDQDLIACELNLDIVGTLLHWSDSLTYMNFEAFLMKIGPLRLQYLMPALSERFCTKLMDKDFYEVARSMDLQTPGRCWRCPDAGLGIPVGKGRGHPQKGKHRSGSVSQCPMDPTCRGKLCDALLTVRWPVAQLIARRMCNTSCAEICALPSPSRKTVREAIRDCPELPGDQQGCCYLHKPVSSYDAQICTDLKIVLDEFKCTDISQVLINRLSQLQCACSGLPRSVQLRMSDCREAALLSERPTLEDFQQLGNVKEPPAALYGLALAYYKYSRLPLENLLKEELVMSVIPKTEYEFISNEVVVNNLRTMSRPVALSLMGKRLASSDTPDDLLKSFFDLGQCGVWKGLTTDGLGRLGVQSALTLCDCGKELDMSIFTSKVDILCGTIERDTTTFEHFRTNLNKMGIRCILQLLRPNSLWLDRVLDDDYVRQRVCQIIGNTKNVDQDTLELWAPRCKQEIVVGGDCTGYLPTFTSNPPTYDYIVACSEHYCLRLCDLPTEFVNKVRDVLRETDLSAKPAEELMNLACFAYLPGVSVPESSLPKELFLDDGSADRTSCKAKIDIGKEYIRGRQKRRKRQASFGTTCEEIVDYETLGIPPNDVITGQDIEGMDGAVLYSCLEAGLLSDDKWDIDTARTLLRKIRAHLHVDDPSNWSSVNLSLLGTIAPSLTPAELRYVTGLNDVVITVFGTVSWWSDDQLTTLAGRFLSDRGLTAADLTSSHIGMLNHIFCGLSADDIEKIDVKELSGAVAVLGLLQRCRRPVLRALASRYKDEVYGRAVSDWTEDDFAEAGIVIAALSGEELLSAGNAPLDHISGTVVLHMTLRDFKMLTPAKLALLRKEAAEAATRKGFCPHMSKKQRAAGHMKKACQNATSKGSAVLTGVLWCVLPLITYRITRTIGL